MPYMVACLLIKQQFSTAVMWDFSVGFFFGSGECVKLTYIGWCLFGKESLWQLHPGLSTL